MSGHYISPAARFYQQYKRYLPAWLRLRITLSRMDTMNEMVMLYHLLQHREKDRVMLDVGSSFGSSFIPFAFDGWTVHSFEPDDRKWEVLEGLARQWPKVTLHKYAVSDHTAEDQPFYTSPEDPGLSSLNAWTDQHTEAKRVTMRTLDEVLAKAGINRVSLLKTDTEGFDFLVLKGFPWDRIKPRFIMNEVSFSGAHAPGYTIHQLAELLQAQGYKLLVSEWEDVVDFGNPSRWYGFKTYPFEVERPEGGGNLIAVRDWADWVSMGRLAEMFNRRFFNTSETSPNNIYSSLLHMGCLW